MKVLQASFFLAPKHDRTRMIQDGKKQIAILIPVGVGIDRQIAVAPGIYIQ